MTKYTQFLNKCWGPHITDFRKGASQLEIQTWATFGPRARPLDFGHISYFSPVNNVSINYFYLHSIFTLLWCWYVPLILIHFYAVNFTLFSGRCIYHCPVTTDGKIRLLANSLAFTEMFFNVQSPCQNNKYA